MGIPTKFDEPPSDLTDPADLFRRYLTFYRGELVRRISALDDEALVASSLPSGWTPLHMLSHLVHMEQRWFVWGFQGRVVEEPWGDHLDGSWHVPDDVDVASLFARLDEGAAITDEILRSNDLSFVAAAGGRFTEEVPTLAWICFHVLQEYARHLGHLDIAVELAGGPTGEVSTV